MAANWWDSYKREDDESKNWWESYSRADESSRDAGGGRGFVNPPLIGQPQPVRPAPASSDLAPVGNPMGDDFASTIPTAVDSDNRGIIQRIGSFLRPAPKPSVLDLPASEEELQRMQQADINRRLSYGAGPIRPEVVTAADQVRSARGTGDEIKFRDPSYANRVGKVVEAMDRREEQSSAQIISNINRPALRDAANELKADEFRSVGEWAADTLSSLSQGAVTLAQLPTNIIAPSSSLAESLRKTQKELQAQESDVAKASREVLRKRVESEDGFLGQYFATVKELVTNPTLAINEALKQVPMFLGVIGGARVGSAVLGGGTAAAGRIAPTVALADAIAGGGITAAARATGAMAGGLGASMIMAGGDAAGNTYETLTDPKRTPLSDWQKNPDFQKLVEEGKTEKEAIQELATTKARMAALITAPLGVLGFMGAEAAVVGRGLGRAAADALTLKGAAKLVIKDNLGEQFEEGGTQFGSNLITKTVKQDQNLMEGVPEAMAMAGVTSTPFSAYAARNEYRAAQQEARQTDSVADYLARLEPGLRDQGAEFVSPQETVRRPADVGPSPLAPGVANFTPPELPVPPPAPAAPPDLTARSDTALDNIRNAASVDDAVSNLDVAAGTGMLDTLTPPVLPPLASPDLNLNLGQANPALEAQYGLDQLRALNPAPPVADATAPAPAPLADTTAAPAPAPLAAPRPSTIRGTPVTQLTDADLTQIVGDETAPPISRRSASIELTARQTQAPELRQTATTASLMAPFAGTQGVPSATVQNPGPAAQTANTSLSLDTQPGAVGMPDTSTGVLAGDAATADARARAQRSLDVWAKREKVEKPIKLGTATPEEEAAVNQIAEALGSQFSGQIFAFSDPVSKVEGVTVAGRAFVNTAAPVINSAATALHEFKHTVEQIADAETKAGMTGTAAQQFTQQIDSIFDDISEPGKRVYVERFLHKAELDAIFDPKTGKGTGTKADREARLAELMVAPTTRSEMTADFLGNRATDKQFWREVAQQDPQGFTGFVQKWIGIVDNLLAKLKGDKSQKRQESARVDTYVQDLQKAKMVAREALIAYSKSTRAEATAAQAPAQTTATTTTATAAQAPAQTTTTTTTTAMAAPAGSALALAQSNNTFTGQALGAGRSVGMTQRKGTPVDKLFSNFADMKLPANWVDQTGQRRTRKQAEAQNSERFREGMFARANKNPQQFAKDPLSTQAFDLGDGVTVQLDAAKAGNTRVQMRVGGDVVAAAAIQKGMVDAIAVPERFKGQEYGAKLLKWVSDNNVANIEEVPDRSPGFVAIQKKVLSEARAAQDATPAPQFSKVRNAVPEETEISTQNPQAVNRLYNPIDDMLSIDEAAVREAMALPVKSGKTPLAESITNAILGYGFVPRDTPRDKVIEVYKQSIVSNLMYLFGKVPKTIRERSKLWYDGAHRIATDMGKVYGVKMEQVAGIMAAMSPQKDWFQNVSMAERALDILTGQGNKAWDDNMLAYAKSYVEETRDRKEREKRQKAYDRAVAVANTGTVLDDMNEDDAAVFIRSYDEAYHSRQYRIVTPEGGFGDLVRNADGTPSTMMWSTYDPIVKSVSIFRDGSRKNISEQLGEEHKIRSFYNNIAAPNSPISHVTIDTHAVAAGHFEALAGTDKEVTDNFGGTGGSSLLGVGGTYGIVADAYRTAAKMAGVSAREMQSITWEAVRGLFGENIKSSIKPKVREVWSQFRDGKLSFAAARRAIVKIAESYNKTKGGILNPDWVGSGPGQTVADGGTSYDKSFVPEGGVRLRESKELREKVTINLSAATSSIPGLKELYARALDGEAEATQLLQQVAESSLRFLLGGTKARLVVAPSTGVYMSDREPSISIQVAFDESESKPVLAALAAFADSYNQQQIHVRVPTIQPLGHEFADGSYATPVYEIDLQRELSADDISAIIADSGLKGFTVTPTTLTAYWVQPTDGAQDADDFKTFRTRIARVQALAGQPGGRPKQRVERLYAYGEGDGARVPYSAIRGDVRTKADSDLDTPRLIAEYLNKGPVRTFAQKPLTAAQTKEQKQLAQIFEALPSNDLERPVVRQAYDALASALKEQFQVLPIKVEVMASVDIDGKAYSYWGPKAQTLVGKLVDEGMTADQARRALQYLQRNYGTPSKSWKSGPLSKVKAMDGEPYPNSAAMRRDVSVNNRFRVYKTAPATFGPTGSDFSAHPLLQDSGLKDVNGYPMLYNDLLRAVHDYFAHNLSATQFGPTGEAAAWRNHMASTPDPLARWALTAETRLQNAWQNFRPGAEKLTVAERGFAEQKAALPPVQYTLTGDAQVDAPMQAYIDGLPEQDRLGSLPPDVKIKGMATGGKAQFSAARRDSQPAFSIAQLQGRQVSMPVRVEDTGETGTLTMDAGDSLADINEREAAMQRLLECLRK